ncbi:MAG: YfiR family protein, partial [Bacteroidota bacterium]
VSLSTVQAQAARKINKNYLYYPVYIYNFCKYIQWPEQGNEIVIGVLGNSAIIPQLQRMAYIKSNPNMRFIIKRFNDEKSIGYCHVLFLPNTYNVDIKQLYRNLQGKNILFITEDQRFIRKYSCINFITVRGKPLFQMNTTQMSKAKLAVSNKLLSLAIVVRQ